MVHHFSVKFRWGLFTALLLIAARLAGASLAAPSTPNDTPPISLDLITADLTRPVHVTHAGDGSGRLFIVEQAGVIRIYQSGLLAAPFLDIHGRVRSPANTGDNEEGMFSVAFPPDYGSHPDHFYIYYTNLDGNNQVSRFSLSADPNRADPASEELILLLPHPDQSNHNGGQLAFSPDGYLYIGPGDGGGGNDPYNNAQNPASLLGKLLRIDVEFKGAPTTGLNNRVYLPIATQQSSTAPRYSIPSDNPFVDEPGYRPEIWAVGLRNPWRFSFDRLNGDLYIGDVGQGTQEEIDYQPAASLGGENYGWDLWEGTLCLAGTCNLPNYVPPVHTYPHGSQPCASITGGLVARSGAGPALQGIYFFADYCSGAIGGLQKSGPDWTVHAFSPNLTQITSFGEDENGALYLVRQSGALYRITSP